MNWKRYFSGNKKAEKETINQMLEAIDLEKSQKVFIKERFTDILFDDFDSVAIKNKLVYQVLSVVTLLCSASVPFIANTNFIGEYYRADITALAGVVSTLAFGVLYTFRNEKVWVQQRITFEILRTEGYMFLTSSGKYSGKQHKDNFPLFAYNIESIIREDIKVYFNVLKKEDSENQNNNPVANKGCS